jgi:hypothetical protein
MLSYESQIKKAQAALEEGNVSRVEELLRLYTPKAGEPDIRGFEWYYLWQSSHQEIQTLELEHPIAAQQILPDGEHIAIGQILPAGSEESRYRIEILPFVETGKVQSFSTQSRGVFSRRPFAKVTVRWLKLSPSRRTDRYWRPGKGQRRQIMECKDSGEIE